MKNDNMEQKKLQATVIQGNLNVTIRSNEWDEFVELIKSAENRFNVTFEYEELKQGDLVAALQKPPAAQPVSTDTCPVHNVPMSAKQGKFGTFYSHFSQSENGWCNGKGVKKPGV